MGDLIRKTMKSKLVMSILSIALGIFLIVKRSAAIGEVIRIIGILLFTAALINLITWLTSKDERNQAGLAVVILCVIAGIIFIARPQWLVNLFPIIMGLVLIVNALSNIFGLSKNGAKGGTTTASLVLSILSLVFGIVILFKPGAIADIIIAIVGITFLVNGISDLLLLSTVKKD